MLVSAAMEEAPHILVVDDDRRLRDLLQRFLSEHDFRVSTARDASDARRQMASITFDLLVLDVMMPGESGFDLTRSLRGVVDVPILLLTARAEAEDRITGLELGADDYLVKPFEPRELVARIRTILRRVPATSEPASLIRLGDYSYNPDRLELVGPDRTVRLTSAEARLLRTLAGNAGTPVSREALKQRSQLGGNLRAVDVQVTRLRRKFEPDPKVPRYLQTIRGQGYVLWPD
jgi:two-component system, OmpR family, phosphate regulon response regulator OmpR